jgi:hypothetical protein
MTSSTAFFNQRTLKISSIGKIDNLVEVIEHYGGTVDLHWSLLAKTLKERKRKEVS